MMKKSKTNIADLAPAFLYVVLSPFFYPKKCGLTYSYVRIWSSQFHLICLSICFYTSSREPGWSTSL